MKISSHAPTFGFAVNASQGGRMSLPVSDASYIYSHFRHVSGVPAPEGTRGIAITKLKILDVLIEQLGEIKKKPDIDIGGINPSDRRVDTMIRQYEDQIRTARAVNSVMPYVQAPSAPAGMLFSLTA
jgi:hypothetical protein